MKLVVLGLSITSAWGNGHATTYRGLIREFARLGHKVVFLERDVPWYASQRDLRDFACAEVILYQSIEDLRENHAQTVRSADAVIVGSYVPDGIEVGDWVLKVATGVTAFYDIDTPVTLAQLERGGSTYLSREQIARYDLYLSFAGGR
jgi:spore maturation protein CgeB